MKIIEKLAAIQEAKMPIPCCNFYVFKVRVETNSLLVDPKR